MTAREAKPKPKIKVFDYSELAGEIKSGHLRPVYLLSGDEEYLITKICSAIRKRVVSEAAGEADTYISDRNGNGIEPGELRALAYTPPFLSLKRLTVIKNTGLFYGKYPETSDLQKVYIDIFEGLPEFACLIFVEPKVDKRKRALIDALSVNGIFAEIERQTDSELGTWITSLFRREGIRVDTDAVSSLIERTDKQMLILEQEIRKLTLYSRANSISSIDTEILDRVCIPDLRSSVFKMMDAIGMKKTVDALVIFDKLLALREAVTKIRFLLARHVRQLICSKDLGRSDAVIAKLGVMPFVARNLVTQAGMFSMSELLDLYRRCQQSDALVKSGRMEERQSLEWVLFSADRAMTGR